MTTGADGRLVCVRCGRVGSRGFDQSSGDGRGTNDTYCCSNWAACLRRQGRDALRVYRVQVMATAMRTYTVTAVSPRAAVSKVEDLLPEEGAPANGKWWLSFPGDADFPFALYDEEGDDLTGELIASEEEDSR